MLGVLNINLVGRILSQNDNIYKNIIIKEDSNNYLVTYLDSKDKEVGYWWYSLGDICNIFQIDKEDVSYILGEKLEIN